MAPAFCRTTRTAVATAAPTSPKQQQVQQQLLDPPTLSSIRAASCARVLVGWGSPLGDNTSHMMSRWGAPRMGSGTTRTGLVQKAKARVTKRVVAGLELKQQSCTHHPQTT